VTSALAPAELERLASLVDALHGMTTGAAKALAAELRRILRGDTKVVELAAERRLRQVGA
jgi:hypothetical protein